MCQLGKSRSALAFNFQAIFGLFLWTTGCQRQTIDALHHCGLSLSFVTLTKLREQLANRCIELAAEVAVGPHVLCWDNVNISTSIFVEQRRDAPSKVQSGTFAILYKVHAPLSHLALEPIMTRAANASDLNFNLHIKPTFDQMQATRYQMHVIIVRILTTFSRHFEGYAALPKLQHRPRKLLKLRKTATYPLRVTTINEATIEGTIKVWEDAYEQMKRTPGSMSNLAVPSINDQLTNARVRGARALRIKETSSFRRLDNIQLGYGVFHKLLNYVWALLKIHQGAIHQLGSLKYFFALLEKTRLCNEKPDYHTLLSALMQILHGIILAAWRSECGYSNLAEFAASKPSPELLLEMAETIMRKYATPMDEVPAALSKKRNKDASDSDSDNDSDSSEPVSSDSSSSNGAPQTPAGPSPLDDCAHRNIRILVHDLLYAAELVRAVSDGDWGRIEDTLGQMTMIFRGAGCNNYSTELLHFIRNLKMVWGDEFADIMRESMLVNPSGLAGHWMGTDMNIEHLIGYLKVSILLILFSAS